MRGFFLAWVWGWIRCFGCCGLWFRPYGGSLWQTPQSNQRSGPRRSAPRFGSVFLRSGIHPRASPTVCFAAPPLDACGCAARSLRSPPPDKSLHSAFRWGRHVKSGTRANAHRIEWWEAKAKAKAEEAAGVELHAFLNPSSTRYFTSAHLSQTPHPNPLPPGEG